MNPNGVREDELVIRKVKGMASGKAEPSLLSAVGYAWSRGIRLISVPLPVDAKYRKSFLPYMRVLSFVPLLSMS
jgi:hypothetical protein